MRKVQVTFGHLHQKLLEKICGYLSLEEYTQLIYQVEMKMILNSVVAVEQNQKVKIQVTPTTIEKDEDVVRSVRNGKRKEVVGKVPRLLPRHPLVTTRETENGDGKVKNHTQIDAINL